jgi:carotenoid cleavage dioxygenase-like enzyme
MEAMDIPEGPCRIMPTSMLSSGAEDLEGLARELELSAISGQVPEDISGHLFVAGSIASLGRPAFTGEGTIYRFDLEPGRVRLKQNIVRPPCHFADRAASSYGELMEFRDFGLSRISPLLGVRSVLSNSPIPLGGRMVITTDAGRPWEFDPVSLELVTPIGKADEWLSAIPVPWPFPLVLSTAHPAEDTSTGEVFTVNFSNPAPGGAAGFSHLIRWMGKQLEHFSLIDEHGEPVQIYQCIHEIQVTKHWVLIQDSAFVVELRQMALDVLAQVLPVGPLRELLGSHTMRTQRPTTVIWAVRRKDLRPRSGGFADLPTPVVARKIELAGEAVHFYADFDDGDGEEVTLIVPHTPTLDVSEWIQEGDDLLGGGDAGLEVAGMQVPCALARGRVGVHVVRPRSGAVVSSRYIESDETWGLALATFAPRGQDKPIEVMFFNTSGFAPELMPARLLTAYASRVDLASLPLADGQPPRLLDVEVATGELKSWTAPNGWSLLSPNFIPRRGGANGPRDGYVAVLAHSSETVPRERGSTGEELWLFDAQDITKGPIVRLGHAELDFAFTIHGSWVPELRPSRRDYKVDVRGDLDLEFIRQRALGSIAFSSIFNETIGRLMRSDDVESLLTMAVFPHF